MVGQHRDHRRGFRRVARIHCAGEREHPAHRRGSVSRELGRRRSRPPRQCTPGPATRSWHSRAVPIGTAVLAAVALLWRRRLALAALTGVTLALSAKSLAYGESQRLSAFLPLLAGAYAVGRWQAGRQAWLGVPIVLAGLAVHDLRDPSGGDFVFWLVVAFAAAVGPALQSRSEAASLLRERTEKQREAVARA
jgi:hypothetical protein